MENFLEEINIWCEEEKEAVKENEEQIFLETFFLADRTNIKCA